MLVQVYIAKLGTASVAANAVSTRSFSVLYAAPSAVATLAVTIVGQCIGAGEKTLARRYGRSMVWLYRSGVIVTGDRNAVYSDSVKALSGAGRNGSDDLPGTDHCGSQHAVFWGIQCASFCHAFGG